jgi:FkbM family methyltransferase
MSTNKDRAEAQARSFRAAAIGSVISDDTLGVAIPIQAGPKTITSLQKVSRSAGFWRAWLRSLRDYLRNRRTKRREKRIERLRQALVSAGVASSQLESSQRLSVIENQLEQVILAITSSTHVGRIKSMPVLASPKLNGVDWKVTDFSAEMEILRARVDLLVNRNLIQLTDERVAIRTPYGYVICPQSEYHLIIYLSEGGAHEPGTCRVLESLIEPGDHVIDVGAQIGLLSLVMGRAVGASGRLIAIEASQLLVDCIRRTLLTNGLQERCDVLQIAVSDKAGTATFHLAERSGHSSLFPLSEESQEVQIQTAALDELLPTGGRISLVKIDVEGAELLALQGMSRILGENPEVVLVVEFGPSHLIRLGQTINHWLGAFRDRGFDYILEIDEELAICRPLRSESELSKVQSLNLVFARSSSSRISRIPIS